MKSKMKKEVKEPIEFTPIKLDVNYAAFNKAVKQGEAKINNFIEALNGAIKTTLMKKILMMRHLMKI